MGHDHVSRGVSVLCLLAASVVRFSTTSLTLVSVMSDQWRMLLYMVMHHNVILHLEEGDLIRLQHRP